MLDFCQLQMIVQLDVGVLSCLSIILGISERPVFVRRIYHQFLAGDEVAVYLR